MCGAAEPTGRAGSLFGVPIRWRVGPIPTTPCGQVFWARALLPGTPGWGIRLYARSQDQLNELLDLASRMRLEGDKARHGSAAPTHSPSGRLTPNLRHSSAISTKPPSASFQRRSHSSTKFTRSFIASVAFQGIARLFAMPLCKSRKVTGMSLC